MPLLSAGPARRFGLVRRATCSPAGMRVLACAGDRAKGGFVATDGRSRQGATFRPQRRPGHRDEQGIIPVLAMAARDVEQRVERGQAGATVRDRFQAVALLARAERERLRADPTLGATKRAAELKRVDGIAAILARTAAHGSSLFALLADDAPVSEGARRLVREMSA